MSEAPHAHTWIAVSGGSIRVYCACGTTGYRSGPHGTGAVKLHRKQPGFEIASESPNVVLGTGSRKPTLDDYDDNSSDK